MKYSFITLTLVSVFVLTLSITPILNAQEKGSSEPKNVELNDQATTPNESNFQLVPCDGFSGTVNGQKGVDCDFNMLYVLFNRILKYFIFLFGPIATAMVCYAGFIYLKSSDNPDMLKHAKDMIKNIGIGIFLVLGAWLIVYEFMNKLLVDTFPSSSGTGTQTKEEVIKLQK